MIIEKPTNKRQNVVLEQKHDRKEIRFLNETTIE